jgi:hypothetical protein
LQRLGRLPQERLLCTANPPNAVMFRDLLRLALCVCDGEQFGRDQYRMPGHEAISVYWGSIRR